MSIFDSERALASAKQRETELAADIQRLQQARSVSELWVEDPLGFRVEGVGFRV